MLRRFLAYLRDFEPAQLQAWKTTLFALLADLGVTLGTDVRAEVGFWVGVGVVVLTQVQAILTRFGVFAPATVQKIRDGRE